MTTGVYKIVCTVTGQTYVGSAAKSFAKRFAQHRHELRQGKHKSTYMQRSWAKYGESAFRFEVLQVCAPEDVLACEQQWIDRLSPAYNTSPSAGSTFGTRRTPEQRARIAAAHKGSNDHRPDRGTAHLQQLVKTPEFRAAQAMRLRANIAAGKYAQAQQKRIAKVSKRYSVHGEELTLVELAAKYGRTVKALQRRVERGARGDDIVAAPYAVRRA